MDRRDIWRWALFAAAAYFLYFYGASERGLVGPDEPRYAFIAREMADSGDWVTPRLYGEPWFEKPALIYWLGAAADRLGVEEDLATRVPVALLSVLFLIGFHWRIRRTFGEREADFATLVLGTSLGWVAFSNVGVFDAPVTAATAAALLVLLDWVRNPKDQTGLPWFGAFLGLAVLAKGLVGPAVAALAVLSVCRDRGILPVARDLISVRTLGPFLAVAGPWYLLCYFANGSIFLEEFIWRHHILRLVSPEIQHVQPFWYYVPVLLAAMSPWTPLLFAPPVAQIRSDPRIRFLAAWAVGGFLFFSVATNKLPGYILPVLPALALLIGIRLAQTRLRAGWAAACGLPLLLLPAAEDVLPAALADGLSRAWPPETLFGAVGFVAAAGAVAVAASAFRGRQGLAVALAAAFSVAGYAHLKSVAFPTLDEHAGARPLWKELEPHASQICLEDSVRRHIDYGLAFYAGARIPPCALAHGRYHLAGDPPELTDTFQMKHP